MVAAQERPRIKDALKVNATVRIFDAPCPHCNQPIAIPGLDAALCPHCGWIELRTLEEQAQAKPKKQRGGRKKSA